MLSVPLSRLGGEVAYHQKSVGLHFIAEHPKDSDQWSLPEWKKLAEEYDIAWTYVDQCMADNAKRTRDAKYSGRDARVRKPSEFWASDERLIKELRPPQGDGRHAHADLAARVSH